MTDFVLDYERPARVGFGEAIFCAGKTPAQIDAIVNEADARTSLLLTRLSPETLDLLTHRRRLEYHPLSRTAYLGDPAPVWRQGGVAIITAGTSDLAVAHEAKRTLRFNGVDADLIADVGVAGLWRLLARLDEIRKVPVLVAVAGMDAALPTVLGGLVGSAIIAVPTSVGYGVAAGGQAALHAILASCAPGVPVMNIDNGYGAACAALRILNALRSQT
jgi:NCAIR mutase (PurE)-related protein